MWDAETSSWQDRAGYEVLQEPAATICSATNCVSLDLEFYQNSNVSIFNKTDTFQNLMKTSSAVSMSHAETAKRLDGSLTLSVVNAPKMKRQNRKPAGCTTRPICPLLHNNITVYGWLTACSTVLPDRLTGPQIVQTFPAFYETRHLSLS